MIGAIEMARYMGIDTFYIFGLDCFRKKSQYYYDGRRPEAYSENNIQETYRVIHEVPTHSRIYVTPRLKRMILKLKEVAAAGLWQGTKIYCVNSPWSQQKTIPKISMEEFHQHHMQRIKQWAREAKRPTPEMVEKAEWDAVTKEFLSAQQVFLDRGYQLGERFEKLKQKISAGVRNSKLLREIEGAIESFRDATGDDGSED